MQFTEISENISTTTKYLSESAELIKEEVAELKELVGMTAQKRKKRLRSSVKRSTGHRCRL